MSIPETKLAAADEGLIEWDRVIEQPAAWTIGERFSGNLGDWDAIDEIDPTDDPATHQFIGGRYVAQQVPPAAKIAELFPGVDQHLPPIQG